jgi:hypothetical protein
MARFRHLAAALALALLLPAASAWAEEFLSVYEDLPLAPGLTEASDAGVSFDTPAGRIVEAYARGKVKAAEVLKFYAATLPQLGWTRESDRAYRREAEVLRLETTQERGGLTLHFTISPE